MRITIDVPDKWEPKIKAIAQKDGHTNLSAVFRKAMCIFLEKNSTLLNFQENSKSK